MNPQRDPKAYVRVARPSDFPAATRVMTRAFAKDPAMNWYGCVPELVADIDSPSPQAAKSMRNLAWFQGALLKATVLEHGVVTLACIPRSPRASGDDARGVSGSGESATAQAQEGLAKEARAQEDEEIVGVILWLPPGRSLDIGVVTLLRFGIFKVMWGWGFTGVKRLLLEFSPAVEHSLEESFKKHGHARLDSWHLLEMTVDPVYQGQGYGTLLFEEGLKRAAGKPIHLEATTPSTKDIYLHLGFEIDSFHTFGVGDVDQFGIKARGEAATGYPEWVMTRWHT